MMASDRLGSLDRIGRPSWDGGVGNLAQAPSTKLLYSSKGLLTGCHQGTRRGPSARRYMASTGLVRDWDGQSGKTGERGTSYIVDLDRIKHPTGSKKELTCRERELAFGFRVVIRLRWIHYS